MAIGSSLGITLPTQGGNSGTWGTDLNTELQKIIDAVEAQVPASAIDFSTDFDLNGYALTSVAHASFDAQSSAPGELRSIYFNTTGDLYVRDGNNNVIQFSSAGSLNNASAGGLGDSGGTYGTSGITFDWDGTKYNAKNGSSGTSYADVKMNDLQLIDTGSGNVLTVDAPSLAASYALTLPNAVPASAGLFLQGDASGNLSFSNSTAQDITLTSSAELKHGTREICISAVAGMGDGSEQVSQLWQEVTLNSTSGFYIAIPLTSGDRITRVEALLFGGDTSTKTINLISKDACDGAAGTTEATGTTASSGETGVILSGLTVTVASSTMYLVEFDNAHVNDRIAGIVVSYDRP